MILSLLAIGCTQGGNGDSEIKPVTSRPRTVKPPTVKTPTVPGAGATDTSGGVDGGGGVGATSTPKQVKAAIALAMRLATQTDYRKNIFQRFVVEGTQQEIRGEEKFKVEIERMFPALNHNSDVLRWDQPDLAAKLKSPVIDYLRTIQPQILEDQFCPAPDKNHAEASVTKFDLTAKLCFSVKALVRIPKTTLLKEILGLLMHESLHMSGAAEETANEWQTAFDSYFSRTYGYIQERDLRKEHASVFMRVMVFNFITGQKYIEHGEDENARTMLAIIATEMAGLPLIADPIAMELGMRPKKPELMNNYVNSVLAAAQFAYKPSNLGPSAGPSDAAKEQRIYQGEELTKLYEKFGKLFSIVGANYAAYANGEGKSICLLPENHNFGFGFSRTSNEDGLNLGPDSAPDFGCDVGTLPWDGKSEIP